MLHNHVGVPFAISINEYKHWLFALCRIGFSKTCTHLVITSVKTNFFLNDTPENNKVYYLVFLIFC